MRHTTIPTAVAKTLILLTLLALTTTQTPTTAQGQGVQVFIPEATLKNATIAGNDTVAPHLYDWSFDGVDDYLEVAHSTSYATTRHSVWIWLTIPSDTFLKLIFSKGWHGYYRLLIEGYSLFRITRMDKTDFRWFAPSGSWWLGLHRIYYYLDEYDATQNDLWIDGVEYTPTYNINTSYPLCFECSNPLRIMGEPPANGYVSGYKSMVAIYNRQLASSEISSTLSYVVPANGLKLFLDATFFNGSKYIDLSGNGNHGTPYNGVARVPANTTWLWLVKNLTGDGLVHLRFFPPGRVVRFTSVVTGARYEFVIGGSPNQAGLVEDVAVLVPAGVYDVEYGYYVQYVPYTISVYTSSQFYLPGERAYIYFVARDNYGGFVSGLNVAGTLVFPNGTSISIVFSEDSVNQRYVYVFNDTTAVGVYLVNASTVIYGVPGYASAGFRVLPLDYSMLISMVNDTSSWVRKMGIDVPSIVDVAVVDGVLAGLLGAVMIVVIIYFYRNREHFMWLMVSSVIVLLFSIVLMSSRSIVPAGFKTVVTSDNATRIEYIYTENRFALLYMLPIGLSILGLALFVLIYIQQSARSVAGWGGRTRRWGR